MERDPYEGGSDVGRDLARDLGDEPPPALPRHRARHPVADRRDPRRSAATFRRRESRASAVDSPEHDWTLAGSLVRPAFRPVGTPGARRSRTSTARPRASTRCRATPSRSSMSVRPACRSSTPSRPAASTSSSTATTSCRGASSRPSSRTPRCATSRPGRRAAPWTDEVSGERRLISSDTGDGLDAVRILLPEVVAHLRRELGGRRPRARRASPSGTCSPRRRLRPDDAEFAAMFADFVVEQSGGADEPIDRRVFEIVDGRLVEFTAADCDRRPARRASTGRSRRSRSTARRRSTR